MNANTIVELTLIADERFLVSCVDLKTLLSVKRSSLRTALYDEGLEVYSFGEERLLDNWQGEEKEKQLRQDVKLIVTKKLTKNKIYQIINQVEAQQLKFYNL